MSVSIRYDRRTAMTALIGTIALTTATPPVAAHAAPAPATRPLSFFTLTSKATRSSEPTHTATLTCSPDGGTLPNARTACDQLRTVDGWIAQLPEASTVCPLIYAPIRVSAVGLWRGRPRAYHGTFFNRCDAIRATGGEIFDF